MKFIRRNGRIIPIGNDKSGQKQIGSGKKATNANVSEGVSSMSKKATGDKVTRTFSQKIGSKLNGFMNKFKTIDSGKIQSSYMRAKGVDIANKTGEKVTFGATKKVLQKQSIKSGSRLKRISGLMAKNKSAKGRGSLLALSVIAGAGAYGYFKAKGNQESSSI